MECMKNLKYFQKELKTLRFIFSMNEERINQLDQRGEILKKDLGVKLDG